MANSLPWVIAATPRSGTTHVASLLTASGLDTTHERITFHTYEGLAGTGTHLGAQGESSHAAAPFVHRLRSQGTIVVHLLRPPLDTIASLWGRKMLDGRESAIWHGIKNYTPRVLLEPDGPRRCALYWLEWNQLIEGATDLVWRLNEFSERHVRSLASLVNVYPSITAPFESIPVVNPGVFRPEITKNMLGHFLYKEVCSAANRYAIPLRLEEPMDRRSKDNSGKPQVIPVRPAVESDTTRAKAKAGRKGKN